MLLLIRKANHLVFNRGAIARSDTLDLPGVHRRAADVLADDPQGLRRGVGDVAGDLLLRQLHRAKAEGRRLRISGLLRKPAPIDAAAVQPRRCPGLQTASAQAQPFERLPQQHARRLAAAAGGVVLFPAVDQPIKKGAGGNDHGARQHRAAIAQPYAAGGSRSPISPRLVKHQIHYFRLLDVQVCLRLEHLAHLNPVLALVTLRARRPDCGAAGGIQQTELDAHCVGDLAHDPAKCIHFPHQMALGDASDRGVARHLCNEIQVETEQCCPQAHARCGHGRFASGVAGTHNYNVVLFRKRHTGSILELYR